MPQLARHSAVRRVIVPSEVVSPAWMLAVVQQLAGAPEGAGEGAADPHLVLAHRLLVEQRVERDDALHVVRRVAHLLHRAVEDLSGEGVDHGLEVVHRLRLLHLRDDRQVVADED